MRAVTAGEGLSAWVLFVALTGCNAVFGIEKTGGAIEPPVRDSDGDGVINPDDNCVLVANADQADADGDTFGDVCDPCVDSDTQTGSDNDEDGIDDGCDSCLTGINHDEDGDGIGDGCDVCPGVADPSQTDVDTDGIGDACDASAEMQRRVFFDGFGPPDAAWNFGFKPWGGTSDGYAPETPMIGNAMPLDGPWNPNALVMGPSIRVVASAILPPAELVAYTQRVGLSVRVLPGGIPATSCTVRDEQGTWVVNNDANQTPIPVGRVQFTVAFEPAGSGSLAMSCTIAGVTVSPMITFADDSVFVPSLVANVAAEFEWIDVAE